MLPLQIRLNSSATHRRSNSQRSALPRSSRRRPPLFWDTSPYGRSQRIISTLPSGISFIRSRQSPCIRLINLSSPYIETSIASDTRCRYILHCHYMNRHTHHSVRIASSIAHFRHSADSLPVGCDNDSAAHFHADQLFAHATDSALQRLGRCCGYRRIPGVGARCAGLAGQGNGALPEAVLTGRGQQLLCHLAHFAVEV